MRPIITLTAVSISALFLWSCNAYSTWEKTVSNESTHTLILYITDGSGGFTFTDSLILNPGTSEIIYSFGEELNDANAECEQYINRLSLVAEPGFDVTKDIADSNNWTSASQEGDDGFDHTCSFSISDSDID